MDEIGRGTTYKDGLAIAYACLYHLHYINKSRVLFASHFHELVDMISLFDSVSMYCTRVLEEGDGSFRFYHKIAEGVNDNSHGLKVAMMAGKELNLLRASF